jgi:hypothetical protein
MVKPPAEHWVLDKRVPLALIATVALSTLSIGGTAVIAHYRLGTVETRVERLEISDRQQDRDNAQRDRGYIETLTELRGAVTALRDTITELRNTIRQARPAP